MEPSLTWSSHIENYFIQWCKKNVCGLQIYIKLNDSWNQWGNYQLQQEQSSSKWVWIQTITFDSGVTFKLTEIWQHISNSADRNSMFFPQMLLTKLDIRPGAALVIMGKQTNIFCSCHSKTSDLGLLKAKVKRDTKYSTAIIRYKNIFGPEMQSVFHITNTVIMAGGFSSLWMWKKW